MIESLGKVCTDLPSVSSVTGDLRAPAELPTLGGCLRDNTDPFHYPVLFRIGQIFRPRRLCSIGVLFGWSAIAISRGCEDVGGSLESLCLVDASSAYPGSSDIAADNVRRCLPKCEVTRLDLDSTSAECEREMKSLAPFDMIEVDGGHTTEVALPDLRLAWSCLVCGGVLIADDVQLRPVLEAIKVFSREIDQPFVGIPSSHGTAIWKKA